MKILIVTQIVDRTDPVLGFFHEWLGEFARHVESIEVICLKKGVCDLPQNVTVYSLGKDEGKHRITYLVRFFKYILKLRHRYDAVFVHMNPEYVVLGAPLWKLFGKKIGLWYTHKSVTTVLRIALWLTDVVFTASPESFRIVSPKVRVTGHGIPPARSIQRELHEGLNILSIGRITPSKQYELMFVVLEKLKERGISARLSIVGAPATSEDREYAHTIRNKVIPGVIDVQFKGAVPHSGIDAFFTDADIFLNFSTTGSLDKAILESLSYGVPVFTSNEGARTLLGDYTDMFYTSTDPDDVVLKIASFLEISKERKEMIVESLRKKVEEEHALSSLVPKILTILKLPSPN